MERILYRFPDGCAVCEDGRLAEFIDLRESSQSGDIILAKVNRMMPGMDCAFADIGRKRDGFLPLKENSQSFTDDPVRSGAVVAVQIRREENGAKGAYLSRDLTIPGKTVILMPKNRYIGVSSRIQGADTRERLRQCGKKITEDRCGIVMRAAAETAPEEEIRAEFSELMKTWTDIRDRMNRMNRPGDILFAQDPAAEMIRDYAAAEEDVIRKTEIPAEIRRQLAVSAGRKVNLPGGGNIVIDRCEAMTVIDVNSAAAGVPGDKESSITATNMEACFEASLQVRLRDIAGIIMIDFIDMEKEENRIRVEEYIRDLFSRDRRKTVIHGWTRLGILEMTRKRK